MKHPRSVSRTPRWFWAFSLALTLVAACSEVPATNP